LIGPAFVFTAISYSCLSYTFVLVNRAFGINVSRRDLFEISLITTILNHLVTTGGAAGFGIRLVMLRQRGAEVGDIAAATLFHVYLDGLGMLALLPFGLLYLLIRRPFSHTVTIGIAVVAAIVLLLFALASGLILSPSLRTRAVGVIGRIWHVILRRDVPATLNELDSSMERGVAAVRRKPLLAIELFVLTLFDWMSSMTVLWFCFHALSTPLSFVELVTGFSVGLTAGALSMIPGGLGVQEGSMAGIYALLGTPFQRAILAAILFRVIYYLIPYVITLALYRRLLRYKEQPQAHDGSD
jgi:uncharacterized protein (TIRG00374 family)